MGYGELRPPAHLAEHLACVWWSTGAATRVLPDGCVDVVWTGSGLVVAGPATRAAVQRLAPDEPRLGVRFRVGAAGAVLGLPASELLDTSPSLGAVWLDGDRLTERVGAASSAADRLRLMVAAVGERIARLRAPDPLVRGAVLRLARPRTAVAQLGDELGISERQLRRRFESSVGYSPRTLSRVLRLQRFLTLAQGGAELAGIAAAAGYADQPHLSRDCSRLAGLTPAALLATGAGPAGESLTTA